MPFSGPTPGTAAKVQLEQVDAKQFQLLQAFRYLDPKGRTFVVTPDILGLTDLTSVPSGFRWFVNTYGRHTLPALLHDCLIRAELAKRALQSGDAVRDRQEADDIFLVAMKEQGVATIRRRLMWSAVTFNTRFRYLGWPACIGMILWTLAALAGTGLLYRGAWAAPDLASTAIGLAGPLPFALLCGRSASAGIWFGYGIALLLPAGVVVHVSYFFYWCFEHLLAAIGLSTRPPTFRHF